MYVAFLPPSFRLPRELVDIIYGQVMDHRGKKVEAKRRLILLRLNCTSDFSYSHFHPIFVYYGVNNLIGLICKRMKDRGN